MTAINSMFETMTGELSALFPQAMVNTHPGRFDEAELKRIAVRAPAVLLACLGTGRFKQVETDEVDIPLNCTAFVLTKDERGLPRETGVINISEVLLTWLPGRRWNMPNVSPPSGLMSQNLFGKQLGKMGVTLWAVSWVQNIRLGVNVWEGQAPIISEIYAGYSPEIGAAHEPDYERIEEPVHVE